ncbi:MAG TPA: hypothetical protein VJ792_01155 [Candidatus Nitrosotalea sp.]|nr:hypothetical protein [Candidatus Nitrosotalea sp.]
MGLDIIEEKNLNDIIEYALEYPKMVLAEARNLSITSNLEDFAYGIYVGYICGVFFDGFLQRNKRYLDLEESSDFHGIILKRTPEIRLRIKSHLRL